MSLPHDIVTTLVLFLLTYLLWWLVDGLHFGVVCMSAAVFVYYESYVLSLTYAVMGVNYGCLHYSCAWFEGLKYSG